MNPFEFRTVLAVMITNKVDNEMKERIVFNLRVLAKSSQNSERKSMKFLFSIVINKDKLPLSTERENLLIRNDDEKILSNNFLLEKNCQSGGEII